MVNQISYPTPAGPQEALGPQPQSLPSREGYLWTSVKSFAITVFTSDWPIKLANLVYRVTWVLVEILKLVEQLVFRFRQLSSPGTASLLVSSYPEPPPLIPYFGEGRTLRSQSLNDLVLNREEVEGLEGFRPPEVQINSRTPRPNFPTDDPAIAELVARGYLSLARELQAQKGEEWGRIHLLSAAPLMEELSELSTLLLSKEAPSDSAKKITDFAFHMAEALRPQTPVNPCSTLPFLSFEPQEGLKEVMEHLGKLMFLLNKDPAKAAALLDLHDLGSSKARLNEALDRELESVEERLSAHKQAHDRTVAQQSDRAYKTLLPVELSKLLLNDDGSINNGLITPILGHFLKEEDCQMDHEVNLLYGLQLLARSPRLREKFSNIKGPKSDENPSTRVIRTMLRYDLDTEVTDLDAKRCALAGILSHLRQGSVGSCFATFVATQLLSSHLDRCLDDFQEMLGKGSLSRRIGDSVVSFPYLLRMSTDNIRNGLKLNKAGKVIRSFRDTGCIWENPGLQAACRSIGITDVEARLKLLLSEMFECQGNAKANFLDTSPKEIIKLLCLSESCKCDKSARWLFLMAAFAFEAETSSPLLRVWENSIAGMAEGDLNGMVRGAIVTATAHAIFSELRDETEADEDSRNALFDGWVELLGGRIRLHYDPDVPHKNLANDGHSTEGAFVLYDTQNSEEHTQWIRVDNPAEYQAFTLRTLEESWSELKGLVNADQAAQAEAAMLHLRNYVKSGTFVRDALYHYDVMNVFGADPLKDYQALEHAPWVDKCGNNTVRTIQVYLELENKPQTKRVQPSSAEDLLTRIVNLAQGASDETKLLFEENPHKLTSVRTPGQHAFTLMLGHPGISQSWHGDQEVSEWIQEQIIAPGLEVAAAPLPDQTRKRMISFCNRSLIGRSRSERFKERLKEIPEEISVSDFRDHLVNIVFELEGAFLKKPQYTRRRIDSRLANLLPEELLSKLRSSAVHFADSNWSSGVNDLHFCFVVNPGSKKLEMWQVQSNERDLWALDQNAWVLKQRWEFFTNLDLIQQADLLGRQEIVA